MSIYKCKMCGSTIEIEEGQSFCICSVCGSKQALPKLYSEQKANLYYKANQLFISGEFDKAEDVYKQIIKEDPSDAEAYWSLVLCAFGIKYVEDPTTHKRVHTITNVQIKSIFLDENYKAAIKYADENQRPIYEEEAKLIDVILKGLIMKQQKEQNDIYESSKIEIKSKKRKNSAIISLPIIIILVALVVLLVTYIIPNGKYNSAINLYNSGKYEEAIVAFTALKGYKDSAKKATECETAIQDLKYNSALDLYNSGKFEEAIEAFKALNGYKDSVEKVKECETAIKDKQYNEAVELYNEGKYDDAIIAFKALNGYRDSEVQITKCKKAIKDSQFGEIAYIMDVGQLYDKGFNQGTYEGAEAYAKANGKTYKYYQPANGADATDNDRIAAMRQAINNGAKVIVTPGFLQATAIETVAKENPDVKFVFVDGWIIGLDNVTAIVYKEEEMGFLAGYAAVMEGYTKLGYTGGGGGANPACCRLGYGFIQGAEAAAKEKNVNVEMMYSFKYGETFQASTELQTQIAGWYSKGTEVVFACGGSIFNSVKSAASEYANAKIIGVDVDQSGESEKVITSAVKGLSASVQKVLTQFYAGQWDTVLANKAQNLGAADDATGLPTETWSMKNFTLDEYNALFAKVKSGEIVPDANYPEDVSTVAWTKVTVTTIK